MGSEEGCGRDATGEPVKYAEESQLRDATDALLGSCPTKFTVILKLYGGDTPYAMILYSIPVQQRKLRERSTDKEILVIKTHNRKSSNQKCY